jgi:hypothetical protein
MDLNVVYSRHSVRSYTEMPIEAELVNRLNEHIEAYNFASGLKIQLVTNEPDAFGASLLAKYGKFKNVENYLCMIGPKGLDEEVGYYGEKLVLDAQQMGLNTCWVCLTYKKGRFLSATAPRKEPHTKSSSPYRCAPTSARRPNGCNAE